MQDCLWKRGEIYACRLSVCTMTTTTPRFSYHQEDILLLLRLLEDKLGGIDYCNINRVVWGCKEDPNRIYLTRHWEDWLGSWLGPLPPLLLDRCCAQFVVHRDRIRRLPWDFYQEALGEY